MKKIGTIDGVVPNYGCPTLAGGGFVDTPNNYKDNNNQKKTKKIEIKR
jgi:hypothetical protein